MQALMGIAKGKVVEQEDFFADTGRIDALEERLGELGIAPVDAAPRAA